MKIIAVTFLFLSSFSSASALVISEIMSNPTGDDNGREWVELYNDGTSDVDISSLSISIKGGNAITATPLQGGTTIAPGGYAIIGSVVSGATKFLQDYSSYSGPLFRASMSLVNTGVTSVDIKLGGVVVASVPSYTAAKEGLTLSFIGGGYVTGAPTPGAANAADNDDGSAGTGGTNATTTTTTQTTLPQMSPPSPNIVIYMPEEKVAVAGAQTSFSVFSLTREGKPLNDLIYTWAFGDGGQGAGSSSVHTYFYSGRYIAQVEALNANTYGTGRMIVRVVAPDISITSLGSGKYGPYIDIQNPNAYDLDLSGWTLTIEGAGYPFPKNTILPKSSITRFAGQAMGFASTTLASTTKVRIMFPSLEEVTHYVAPVSMAISPIPTSTPKKTVAIVQPKRVLGSATTTIPMQVATSSMRGSKDTRIVSWFKVLFGK